jgi:hypothetical protein
MTEQQIRDGFERMDGALEPPLDVAERVSRRIGVRRRRRRAGVVGAAALVVAAGVGTAVVLSGGDEPRGAGVAVDPGPGPVSTLVMTREDGSTYDFDNVTVSCSTPAGYDSPRPGHIYLWTPIEFTGDMVAKPFLYVDGNVAKITGDQTFTYPDDGFVESSEQLPLTLFIADTEGAPDGNELSSTSAATGTVRVLEASCDPSPVLRLQVDLTIQSEEEKAPVELAGSFR